MCVSCFVARVCNELKTTSQSITLHRIPVCFTNRHKHTHTHDVMSTWLTNFYSFTLIYSLKSLDTASSHSPAVTVQMREQWFFLLWALTVREHTWRPRTSLCHDSAHTQIVTLHIIDMINSVTFDTASLKSGLTSITEFTLNQTSNQDGFRMKHCEA